MSDKAIVEVGLDASEAIKAAQALPGTLERNMRRDASKPLPQLTRLPGVEYVSPEMRRAQAHRRKFEEEEYRASQRKLAAEKKATEQSSGTLGKWASEFKSNISGQMVASFSAATLAVKAFGFAVDMAKGVFGFFYDTFRMSSSYGFGFSSRVGSMQLAVSSLLSPDEVEKAALTVQKSMINAVRLQEPGAAKAMTKLGVTESDFKSGKVDPNEILVRLAGKYKSMQGGMEFDILAKQLGLSNWEELIPLLEKDEKQLRSALGGQGLYKGKTIGMSAAGAGYGMGSVPEEQRKMPLMGPGSPVPQMLSNVSSLQAMGGGDILSAVARGATVESNIQRIADNTAVTAGAAGKPAPAQPAIIGR